MLLSFLATHTSLVWNALPFNFVKCVNIRFEHVLRTFLSFSQVMCRAFKNGNCFVNFIINNIVPVLVELSNTFDY